MTYETARAFCRNVLPDLGWGVHHKAGSSDLNQIQWTKPSTDGIPKNISDLEFSEQLKLYYLNPAIPSPAQKIVNFLLFETIINNILEQMAIEQALAYIAMQYALLQEMLRSTQHSSILYPDMMERQCVYYSCFSVLLQVFMDLLNTMMNQLLVIAQSLQTTLHQLSNDIQQHDQTLKESFQDLRNDLSLRDFNKLPSDMTLDHVLGLTSGAMESYFTGKKSEKDYQQEMESIIYGSLKSRPSSSSQSSDRLETLSTAIYQNIKSEQESHPRYDRLDRMRREQFERYEHYNTTQKSLDTVKEAINTLEDLRNKGESIKNDPMSLSQSQVKQFGELVKSAQNQVGALNIPLDTRPSLRPSLDR